MLQGRMVLVPRLKVEVVQRKRSFMQLDFFNDSVRRSVSGEQMRVLFSAEP